MTMIERRMSAVKNIATSKEDSKGNLIRCGVFTQDGKISAAYEGIIQKKQNDNK